MARGSQRTRTRRRPARPGGGADERRLARVEAYYDRRAREYDDWYLGTGLFGERDRPGWEDELARLTEVVAALPPARTLDVACGTGFLTRHLRGEVVGLDQSESMLDEARRNAPRATFVRGDALELPLADGSFDRVFTAHFYGHLEGPNRETFLAEARRVAPELVVVDSSRKGSEQDDARQQRVLNDGSRWEVYKRWFTAEGLAAELGGGETLLAGRWFVAVRST
jgi:ubiquinone/menaquinone biosynthesis C-methylase UbiE